MNEKQKEKLILADMFHPLIHFIKVNVFNESINRSKNSLSEFFNLRTTIKKLNYDVPFYMPT